MYPFVSGIRFDYRGNPYDIYINLKEHYHLTMSDDSLRYIGYADFFCTFSTTELTIFSIPKERLINDLLLYSNISLRLKGLNFVQK